MSNQQQTQPASAGSDLWIAAGVVACLALGAGMTYWLSSATPGLQPPRRVAAQGELINAPRTGNANTPGAAATAAAPANADYTSVNFDTLGSYFYEIPNLDTTGQPPGAAPKHKEQIPAPIKAFNGRKVAVQGFMVPVRIEKGATKAFLLVKDQSLCCFGRMPRMNEWVSVTMAGGRSAKFIGDQPVTVFGKIEVGEEIEKGEVLSIYRLDAEDVAGPLDL